MAPHQRATTIAHDQRRHELIVALTVVYARTQLLQRHVECLDGCSEEARQRLHAGLDAILVAAKDLRATIEQPPES